MRSVFRRFRRKPLRAVLTLLQIVLGSLAMTLALSIYLDAYARQNAAQAERFDLIAGNVDEDGSSYTYSFMSAAGAAELTTLAPDVEKVALYAQEWVPMVELGGRLYQFQWGAFVDNAFFDLNDVALTRGSLFTQSEADAKEAVLLLSDEAAAILFPDLDPLGQTLTLMPDENLGDPDASPQPFRVIGTFAVKRDASGEQDHVYLPTWTQSNVVGGSSTLNVLAKAGRGDAARAQVVSAARRVFAQRLEDWDVEEGKDFYIREMGESPFGPRPDLLDPTVVMFGLFGIAALMVGSIGIFSIMVVDALERERDIGVKRALGATRGSVVRELTLEATLLSGLGGLLGVFSAALLFPLLARGVGENVFWGIDLRWQPLAAGLVVGVTLLLGAALGIFPAWRAGRTNPAQVLKGT